MQQMPNLRVSANCTQASIKLTFLPKCYGNFGDLRSNNVFHFVLRAWQPSNGALAMSCHCSAVAGWASPVAPFWTTYWCPGGSLGPFPCEMHCGGWCSCHLWSRLAHGRPCHCAHGFSCCQAHPGTALFCRNDWCGS
jgi:hypothetical protein